MQKEETAKGDRLDMVINIEDRTGRSKEEFNVSPDEAFLIRDLLMRMKKSDMMKVSGRSMPEWIGACKIQVFKK